MVHKIIIILSAKGMIVGVYFGVFVFSVKTT